MKDNGVDSGWHKTYIKKFFTTSVIPEIEITNPVLEELATESTNRGYTIPGVQKKLSLHLSKEVSPRLTVMNYPAGYILKPQVKEFRALPESEHLVMSMAPVFIKMCHDSLIPQDIKENLIELIDKRASVLK